MHMEPKLLSNKLSKASVTNPQKTSKRGTGEEKVNELRTFGCQPRQESPI